MSPQLKNPDVLAAVFSLTATRTAMAYSCIAPPSSKTFPVMIISPRKGTMEIMLVVSRGSAKGVVSTQLRFVSPPAPSHPLRDTRETCPFPLPSNTTTAASE